MPSRTTKPRPHKQRAEGLAVVGSDRGRQRVWSLTRDRHADLRLITHPLWLRSIHLMAS